MTRTWPIAALMLAGCGSRLTEGRQAAPSPPGDEVDAAPASRDGAAMDAAADAAVDVRAAVDARASAPDALAPDRQTAPDDGGFLGASRCAAGAFLFCDDFEADTLDPVRWSYTGGKPGAGTGYAVIDPMRAARGSRSLHLHTEVNGKPSGAQVKASKPQPWLADGFYLRAFMYFAQPIPDGDISYLDVRDPTPTTGGAFKLGSLKGKLGLVELGPHNGDHGISGAPLIVGRWFCVEWQVHPSTSELRVWVDEVEVPALHATNWSPSKFDTFAMELNSYQGSYDIWIDELAYDPQRIGCRR